MLDTFTYQIDWGRSRFDPLILAVPAPPELSCGRILPATWHRELIADLVRNQGVRNLAPRTRRSFQRELWSDGDRPLGITALPAFRLFVDPSDNPQPGEGPETLGTPSHVTLSPRAPFDGECPGDP